MSGQWAVGSGQRREEVGSGQRREEVDGGQLVEKVGSQRGLAHQVQEPEPGILHDQAILYTFSISGEDPFTYQYISNSNLLPPGQEHVLSEKEPFQLGSYLQQIKRYFYENVYSCDCNFKNFGLDVEFKIDSETTPRKLYIKQVRPY